MANSASEQSHGSSEKLRGQDALLDRVAILHGEAATCSKVDVDLPAEKARA